jgi:hypothetical protein
MTFWASYVLAKQDTGVARETTLTVIETKKGLALRQSIESELATYDASL